MKLKNAAQITAMLRRQHARRDDGRDRVGGVMQPIEEIEDERDGDERDDDVERGIRSWPGNRSGVRHAR